MAAGNGDAAAERSLRDVDETVPHSARIWNYWLGGTDNFAADREAGDAFLGLYPLQFDKARACRYFLNRVVRHLAVEEGVRQFLDVGAGLPTVNNTHEVAQYWAPDARVVYVDNDPLVLAHARQLLTSTPEGVTSFVDGDLHEPEAILAAAARTLDLDRPVALLMIGVLGHVEEYAQARDIVQRLLAGLPRGSFLVQTDGTDASDAYLRAIAQYRDSGGVPYNARTHDQIAGFYTGLKLVKPGVVPIHRWRPEPNRFGLAPDVSESGGVGRKL